jgi:uncharacterized protein YmfQ (DUF2313 family)
MTWLTKTPLAVVRAHQQMLGRLMAEEALHTLNVSAIAHTSNVDPDDRRDLVGRWERAAQGGRPRAAHVSAGDLREMGIGVRVKKGRG